MRTKPQSSQRKMSWAGMLITLTIIILFGCSQKTLAQQWSTSSNGNDISNTNSGNVGIGTSAPANKLDVISSGTWTARFKKTSASNGGILIDSAAGYNPNVALSVDGAYKWFLLSNTSSSDALQFWDGAAGSQPRFTVTQVGNVGIGTTNPFSPAGFARILHLRDPSNASYVVDAGGLYRAEFGVSSNGVYVGATDAIPLRFASAAGEKMRINSNGNVGIGTTAPNYKFDVQGGQVNASDGLCIAGDCKTAWSQVGGGGGSQWTTAGSNISFTTGNVGIGTTTPGSALQVNGGAAIGYSTPTSVPSTSLSVAGNINIGTNGFGGKLHIRGAGTGFTTGIGLYADAGAPNNGYVWMDFTSPNVFTIQGGNSFNFAGTPIVLQNQGGNVGIGTTAPAHRLDVAGQIRSSSGGFVFPDGTVQTTAAGGAQAIFKNIANGSGTIQFSAGSINDSLRFEGAGGTSVSFDANNKKVIISSSTSSSTSSAPNVSAGQFGQFTGGGDYSFPANLSITGNLQGGPATFSTVSGNGANLTNLHASNLVSGTVPIARLGSGTANSTTFLRGDNTWAPVAGGPSQWTSGTNNISYTSGNVGIGTPSPAFLLDVHGGTDNPFRVRDSSNREYFSTSTRGTTPVVNIASRLTVDSTSPDGGNDTLVRRPVNNLIFAASEHPENNLAGAFMVRQKDGSFILTVDQRTNGNVGIGTTNPTAKLDVNGNTNINGNINVTGTGNITAAGTIEGGNIKAKYQDVAEWVESSQELSAGTLVVLDHNRSNQVIASSKAYDTRVAGVISARPGITLGEGGDNKVLVATTGRVKLRVDTSNGPIQIGDLLVTSDIPGVAMKSEAVEFAGRKMHMPGTIIGKALEPLAKGSGEILVLLSLQ